MIRYLTLLAVVVAGLHAAPPARAADAFLSVIEDLPIMDGLAEEAESAVFFETANGRIAEARAGGAVTPDRVEAFYASVLPQLGWRPTAQNAFLRDGERLRLEITVGPQGTTAVRFSLSPAAP